MELFYFIFATNTICSTENNCKYLLIRIWCQQHISNNMTQRQQNTGNISQVSRFIGNNGIVSWLGMKEVSSKVVGWGGLNTLSNACLYKKHYYKGSEICCKTLVNKVYLQMICKQTLSTHVYVLNRVPSFLESWFYLYHLFHTVSFIKYIYIYEYIVFSYKHRKYFYIYFLYYRTEKDNCTPPRLKWLSFSHQIQIPC